jgi:hypothetical protein
MFSILNADVWSGSLSGLDYLHELLLPSHLCFGTFLSIWNISSEESEWKRNHQHNHQ